jgi:hypothetical protein
MIGRATLAADRCTRASIAGWIGIAGLVALLLAPAVAEARGGQQWFSAWTVSQNTSLTTPALSGSSVRMIVRPTVSGGHLRVKLENTLEQVPVVFSAAYVGVTGGRFRVRHQCVLGVTIIPRGRPAPLTGWTTAQEQHRLQAMGEFIDLESFENTWARGNAR